MIWFRIYNEIIDDPKLSRIDGETFRVFIYLLALASEQNNEGRINMSIDDVAWRVRIEKELITNAITILQSKGIVTQENGYINISNWKKRQFTSDNVGARVRRYREKMRNVTCNVTGNVIDTDTDTDTEIYKSAASENPSQPNATKKKPKTQSINFNFETRTWENIEPGDIEPWTEAYPACDVSVELNAMREWLLANPNKRKVNYRRFITNWLSRQQQRGGTNNYRPQGRRTGIVSERLPTHEEELAEFNRRWTQDQGQAT